MSFAPHRLPAGGRIERSARLNFSLDGRRMSGFAGDTLASALLANGVKVVGRSFKYHRPRGFLSAGGEEPNGLFTLGDDGRSEPNIAGTVTELSEGLVARRQNAWPSVAFDLRSINAIGAALLTAGFYYKTFMGPTRGAWMFYERFIRRAAGLGAATHRADPDRYETRHAFADVLVVGGGPAGLAAALAAARAGARVVLAEQDSLVGGSLLSETVTGPAEKWRCDIESELESLPQVTVLRRTTALGVYDGNTVALIERRAELADAAAGAARQVVITLRARAIVYATGAAERPLVFANNDRPGVMLSSAVRTYLNRFAVSLAERAAVVTNNNGAYAAAFDLARQGTAVTVIDQRPAVPQELHAQAISHGIELITGATVTDVHGSKAVHAVTIAGMADGLRPRRHDCDLLCISGGWSPLVHLTAHGGLKPRYRSDIAAFVPEGYAPGQFGAGAVSGTFALTAAINEGADAGRKAARHAGRDAPASGVTAPALDDSVYSIEPDWRQPRRHPEKAFIDFQNDVTVRDLMVAHQEGYESVEHLKRYTTLGMGTDQGKTSNINALAMLASLRGEDIPAVGTTTFRPPFVPVALGALAGRSVGKHFRPMRRSPLHDWHLAHGGQLIEAGPWMRAWWYRWAGPTVERAYIEEMRQVRTAVGIADASTLGKIDLQGPDAAELLSRIYVNNFASLPVGKSRYGVMLSDDGMVLDDGSTTRLSATHYFMTTTTAQAGEVMSWIEFLLQTAWPELRVTATSVTDEWAAMAVAGPQSRAALELALPQTDLSDARLPYMGCLETELDGVPLRVLRLSFSGELAYEVYVPADYGVALWEHIVTAAEPLGIKPYGLEAVASLRIEKGHVAGLELDHRTTLDDLGLSLMASKVKPYVGRALSRRPMLQGPQRWSLVGIECLEPGKALRGGAILFAAGERIEGHGRGYITSVTWSTVLEKFIALGLYRGGLGHTGEEIVCAYPLRDERVRARIVSPVFIDPKGERLRA